SPCCITLCNRAPARDSARKRPAPIPGQGRSALSRVNERSFTPLRERNAADRGREEERNREHRRTPGSVKGRAGPFAVKASAGRQRYGWSSSSGTGPSQKEQPVSHISRRLGINSVWTTWAW